MPDKIIDFTLPVGVVLEAATAEWLKRTFAVAFYTYPEFTVISAVQVEVELQPENPSEEKRRYHEVELRQFRLFVPGYKLVANVPEDITSQILSRRVEP